MAKISKPSPNNSHLRLLLYGGSHDHHILSVGRSGSSSPKVHHQLGKHDMEVVGSSNGLICYSSNHELFIWNPSTNQHHKVSKETENPLDAFLCFTFDPSQDDYILCKITREWGCWITVEAYSLNSSSWNSIGFYNLPFALVDESDPITINGVPHWLAVRYGSTQDFSNHVIVAFDLNDESFFEISFPKSVSTENKEIKMGIFDGCLTLFIVDEDCYSECEVWVMRDYRSIDSWKKEFKISNYTGMVQPFTSTECAGTDGLLVLKNFYGDLFLYDPVKDKEVEYLYNGDEQDESDEEVDFLESCNYNVAIYMESKVSVKRGSDVANRKRKRGCRQKGRKSIKI